MKAILLAGGQGTRLKAVTGDLPKPLVPLLGRPLAEHILRLLKKHGIRSVCAAVRYRAEDVMETLGDGSRLGMRITYRVEEQALGTAGAVKNCADFIGDEDVLVISGDAACDMGLTELMERHRERGAAVTLALHRDASPLRFGLAVTDGEGAVRAFVEKPDWNRVVTDLVNTGIYILCCLACRWMVTGATWALPFPTTAAVWTRWREDCSWSRARALCKARKRPGRKRRTRVLCWTSPVGIGQR